jgi:hypothetical protein
MEVASVMWSPMSKAAGRSNDGGLHRTTCIETTEASLALLQVHKSRKSISNATAHFGSSNEGVSIDLIWIEISGSSPEVMPPVVSKSPTSYP